MTDPVYLMLLLFQDWGAGDTRAPHDGQWGEWAGWTECCNSKLPLQ